MITKTHNKRGQGMTEYIIIVGLIAIFVIGAVRAFGGNVNAGFAGGTVQVSDVNTSISKSGLKTPPN